MSRLELGWLKIVVASAISPRWPASVYREGINVAATTTTT